MSKKSIENTYVKKDLRSHILLRPDTYVGSLVNVSKKMNIYNEKTDKVCCDQISFVPALYKIFDEILVNATDRVVESNCDTIKITIDKETGMISVWNNGDTIDIVKHSEHNVWVPELIFAHLLTGTNFDDDGTRLAGGRNGYGAKLTGIYSSELTIEVLNVAYKKKYVQTFRNNLSVIEEPVITATKQKSSHTKITFLPDYERFGCGCLTDDTYKLFLKRAYDVAGIKKVAVYLNDELISIDGFDKYIYKFYSEDELDRSTIIYKKLNNYWEVGVVIGLDNGFKQISYVNGINTYRGGKHVDEVVDQICSEVIQKIAKKNKTLEVKDAMVKNRFNIFINCLIPDPTFDSQTKEFMTTKKTDWEKSGFGCVLDADFIKEIFNTDIVSCIIDDIMALQERALGKALSSKGKNKKLDIDDLHDAQYAGTSKSHLCTMVFTEGKSALSLMLAAMRKIGNEYIGAMPMKGKILNVRKCNTNSKIMKNEEIKNIIDVLGLEFGKKYTDLKKLRYGRVLIFTDQDYDGFHIKGLFINFIHTFWPSLIKLGFVCKIDTPILKLISKKDSISFYSIPEYMEWKKENEAKAKKYVSKYYKGLGTSTSAEAREYFENYEDKISKYVSVNDEETDQSMEMVFGKNNGDMRKSWLTSVYKDTNYIESTKKQIPVPEFVDNELILFSNADNIRSIPSMYDGLKPSQRKILYVAMSYLKNKEQKVVTFCGKVIEQTDYHHGEMSLHTTVVKMAQNYCGSNNINLLVPAGQFGTRLGGGKDDASPRYIFTSLTPITNYIFIEDDNPILEYNYADAEKIEPVNYYPIIPMILVNGAEGIGTGWSTTIPSYNPEDLVRAIKENLAGDEISDLVPWYRGYKSVIVKKVKPKSNQVYYETEGIIRVADETKINILEIPICKSFEEQSKYLDSITEIDDKKNKQDESSRILKEVKSLVDKDSNDDDINILVEFKHGILQREIKAQSLIDTLKLKSTISITNIHCFVDNKIKKYESVNDLIEEFCIKRLEIYRKRIDYIINKLEKTLHMLFYKKKYINDVLNDIIVIKRQKKSVIVERLVELEYPELSDKDDKEPNYDYLFGFDLLALSEEKLQDLQNKHDEAEEELEYYKNITPKKLWIKELDKFLEKYREFVELTSQQSSGGDGEKKPAAKKTSKKKTQKKD